MKITGENVPYIQVQGREEIPFELFQAGAQVADTMMKEEKKNLADKGRNSLASGPLIHFHQIWNHYTYLASITRALKLVCMI